MIRSVNTNDSYAKRIPTGTVKLCNLSIEVPNHSIDLLYHSLGENFNLGADFHRRDLAATHGKPGRAYRRRMRYCLSEGRVTAPGLDASNCIA